MLHRTSKALRELAPGQRQLSQRERNLLRLADGKSTLALIGLLGPGTQELITQLSNDGYLHVDKPAPHPPVANRPVPSQASTLSSAPSNTPSLASSRMFLFDVCERMFANRHEALAQTLRGKLREARDPGSLRLACLAILHAVEEVNGAQRAAAIAPHLQHLLNDLTLSRAH